MLTVLLLSAFLCGISLSFIAATVVLCAVRCSALAGRGN